MGVRVCHPIRARKPRAVSQVVRIGTRFAANPISGGCQGTNATEFCHDDT
jgi:hypothetical protein